MVLHRARRLVRLVAVAALLAGLSVAGLANPLHRHPGSAYAQAGGCSSASLNGVYGFLFSGSVVAGNDGTPLPAAIPAAVVGLISYDGSGGVSYTFTQNVGGRTASTTWLGSYSLNADCTGADMVVTASGGARSHALAAAAGGTRVYFSATDTDLVGAGVADLLPPEGCSDASLDGAYGALVRGYSVPGPDGGPSAAPVPRSATNLLLADGAGSITRSGTTNVGGTVSPNPATGGYGVQPDCTFTVTFTLANGATTHITGVLLDGGQRAYAIGADPGAVQEITWQRQ